MADVEINKGVQILLERMSSNPDEFIPTLRDGYPKKWRDLLLSVEMRTNGGKDYRDQLSFLNDKEIKALWDKAKLAELSSGKRQVASGSPKGSF
jgi:hypothetical protein